MSRSPHELVAILQSEEGFGRAPVNWLEDQTPEWLSPELARDGWPDFVFSFHDGEEIGPILLKRIAKHTGMRPEDL
jgi:hypothetical protein